MLQRTGARYTIVLYIADLVLTWVALLAARWLRIVLPYGQAIDAEGAALYWPMFVLAALIWSVSLTTFRAYDPQCLARPMERSQVVVGSIVAATLSFAGALYFTYRELSRLLFAYFFALDVAFLLLARLVLHSLAQNWHESHRHAVLIIGAGDVGQRVARSLQPWARMGIEVIGFLENEPNPDHLVPASPPVLGCLADARDVVTRFAVREVIIALSLDAQHQLANLLSTLYELPVNVKIVPDYSEMVFSRATLERLGDTVFVGLKEPVIGPIDRAIKRAVDIAVSAIALGVLCPLLGLTSLVVALGSPGPVLYRSKRIGEGGHPFAMLKFRTMYRDADRLEADLIHQTADGKIIFEKREDDPRVTPVGRFLRRFSLDELPQLWNVLVGEMSLVGPRPELPALVERYEPWQRKRFSVPQGMTGWWQISGRGNKPKYLHAEDDLYYIKNYSLLLDFYIIWRTLGAVIKGEGAF
jgi:exopolysaccharide biosynthesis polyprenyl glycosylphosphotransferase